MHLMELDMDHANTVHLSFPEDQFLLGVGHSQEVLVPSEEGEHRNRGACGKCFAVYPAVEAAAAA